MRSGPCLPCQHAARSPCGHRSPPVADAGGRPSAGLSPARVADRVVFDLLINALVFGAGYRRIADHRCSATTLRRRRDEWIAVGVMSALEQLARDGYDRLIGLDLADVAVDGCLTKAPCGGEVAGRTPRTEANSGSNGPSTPPACRSGSSRHRRTATTHRCWHPPSTR